MISTCRGLGLQAYMQQASNLYLYAMLRRSLWDETVIEIERVLPPASSGPSSQSSESCLHRFQTRFPRPMVRGLVNFQA